MFCLVAGRSSASASSKSIGFAINLGVPRILRDPAINAIHRLIGAGGWTGGSMRHMLHFRALPPLASVEKRILLMTRATPHTLMAPDDAGPRYGVSSDGPHPPRRILRRSRP